MTLATSDEDGVRLWDTASHRLMAAQKANTKDAYSVAFSRDGRTFATGGFDGTVKLGIPSRMKKQLHSRDT